MRTSFSPFLISDFKTGLFNYTEPWVRAIDAFDPLSNAYIYRGCLNKRNGYIIFGRMAYSDNNIDLGDGGQIYGGTLATRPIVPGSLVITAEAQELEDDGDGNLSGDGTGTINYVTGVWTADFNANVTANANIHATYNPNLSRPIMGLKTWVSESNGDKTLLAFDTRRAAKYNNNTNAFEPIDSVSQVIYRLPGVTSIDVSTGWGAVAPYANGIAPGTATLYDGVDTIQADAAGVFTHNGNALPDGTNFDTGTAINYATGVVSLRFVSGTPGAPTTRNITLEGLLLGDYFTGTSSNFFNTVNWLAPGYYTSNPGFLYITNNADPITTYDGSTLSRPAFPITNLHRIAFTNDIAKALDVSVYKNRFLVERPTLVGSANPDAQSIRFSAVNNPTNLVTNVRGNGGELSAPTSDFMQSSEFLRDQLIVLFSNSTWTFRFTGNDFNPFRWDKINNTKSTSAPYGTIDYDERVTAMGAKGLIACDGANVQRYDVEIIDQFLSINQNRFQQCYGLRFDNINQSWMLYPDGETNQSLSSNILVYNFLENSWAIYDLPLSCLGLYYVTQDKTWADFSPTSQTPTTWQQAEFTWNSYLLQELAPNLLGGSISGGYVYQMDTGESDHLPTVQQNEDIATGSGATSYSGTLDHAPVLPGTLIITNGIETFTDNGAGALVRTPVAGGTNTIDYVTGDWAVQFNTAVTTGTLIVADYTYINGTNAIVTEITSARWNPFNDLGQKVQFGYIDFYYDINEDCTLELDFYIDNSETSAATRSITLSGPVGSDVSWKRVYINTVGQYLRMTINNDQEQSFKILGMILWASPSGRLVPGVTVT